MDGRSRIAAPIFYRKGVLSWAYFQSLIWKPAGRIGGARFQSGRSADLAGKADPAARAEKAAAASEAPSKEPAAKPVAKTEAEQEDPAAAETERRRQHEEAEAKRKAEWERQQEEKRAAETAALAKIEQMSETELVKASMERMKRKLNA